MRRYMPPNRNPRKTGIIIVIAALMMLAIEYAPRYWASFTAQSITEQSSAVFVTVTHPVVNVIREGKLAEIYCPPERPVHPQHEMPVDFDAQAPVLEPDPETQMVDVPEPPPPVTKRPVSPVRTGAPVKIVLIIDDMGVSRTNSLRVMDLPAPLTLAFLPYAPRLDEITADSRAKGHELMIHIPMEAVSSSVSLGPLALTRNMAPVDFDQTLEQILNVFDGYVGVNNHMGSGLTQDEGAMHRVMRALQRRGLIFVDSKTIAGSVAEDIAAQHGLRHASRDVFLDHVDTRAGVESALKRLEKTAYRNGVAIGIGHPKENTIAALKAWLPTIKDKNIEIVPVSRVVRRETRLLTNP